VHRSRREGFTLVEVVITVVIIGVLAAFGVPQFLKSIERSKAAEAFNYLAAIRGAQERYIAKNGIYYSTATSLPNEGLDISQTLPTYFEGSVGEITENHTSVAGHPTWSLTLRRKSSSSFGDYTVTYTQDGLDTDVTNSTILDHPEINPMGADAKASSSTDSGT
jgi:prepilin-type N-terminal cleavage/methylation domain-containing protein